MKTKAEEKPVVEPEESAEPVFIDDGEKEPDVEELDKTVVKVKELNDLPFYKRIMLEHPILPHEKVVELSKRFREKGDEKAREKLILHNLRLVPYLAQRFMRPGVLFDDLIQWGNIGLMRAVERYDYRLGYRFATYARWWIDRFIRRNLNETLGPVRLPTHVHEKRNKVHKAAIDFRDRFGRDPEPEFIAEKLKFPVHVVAGFLRGEEKEAFSLDEAIDGSDPSSTRRSELVAYEDGISSETLLLAEEKLTELCQRLKLLGSVLNCLGERSARNVEIFRAYYSLDGNQGVDLTLEEVSTRYNMSRERVRQINRDIWIEIRACAEGLDLDDYKLTDLMWRLQTLSELTSTQIDFRKLLGTDSSAEVKISATSSQGVNSRRKRSAHIRASPAFIHWRPSQQKDSSRVADLIEFISSAYELDPREIRGSRTTQVICWAKALVQYILSRDLGLPTKIIDKHIGKLGKTSLDGYSDEFEQRLQEDELVAQDVKSLRAHFKKATGLD